jgi:type IV pilus assembly protein PilB
MRSTRTSAPTDRRRDSAPINGHGAGSADGDATGAEAQASVSRRLSDFLVTAGLLTAEQLALTLAEQKKTGERLADLVVRLGLLTEAQIVHAQSQHYRIPWVLFPDTVPPELLRLVPSAIARKHQVIPIGRSTGALTLAMVDPTNLVALDDVAFRTGMRVFPVISLPSRIREAIDSAYDHFKSGLATVLSDAEAEATAAADNDERDRIDPIQLRASAEHLPVVRLVNTILLEAVQRGASDVHLEPAEHAFQVRYRIDGVLQDVVSPPKRLEPAVVSRLKIMANLDIAERRLPQDGRIKLRDGTREIDFRVSVIPALFGESVALRLLDRSALRLDLTQLGFDGWGLEQFRKAISAPHGLILVTGPTGSGKSTTLYSALQTMTSPDIHILTLEDPVEYNLPRVNQVQVKEEIGLTFASALRSFLRHDPDVILVGEMRDLETAQIATRAALTGHLVLSTLHTTDAATTVARLVDMGIPPFLLASSLRLVVAQRLIRKVCADCAEPSEIDAASLVPYTTTPTDGRVTVFTGRGCAVCNQTGLKGRIAIYEVMPVTKEIKELIVHGARPMEIDKVARDQGMRTLREAGLAKVLEGVTTLEEIMRVTTE